MPNAVSAQVLKIALPSPLRRLFDYLPSRQAPPDGWQPGLRVRVPFGRREVVGVVVELADHSDLPQSQLRSVSEILDDAPLPADWLWLCQFTARYYQHSLGDTLAMAMPARLRQGHPMAGRTQTLWHAEGPSNDERLSRAPKQAELHALLRQHPHGLPGRAVSAHGFSRDQLLALEKKGLAHAQDITLTAPKPPSGSLLASPALPLNREQATALAALHEKLDGYHPCLLEGVTGSGKTEIYLQLIEAVAAKGKQSLVLVPEIGLTPQTLARFKSRFRVPVLALHSGLTDPERLDVWEAAASGRALIIIGTRSAIFTPLANPGAIIVDEEHDGSYKQQDGLRYHARDLAVARAHRHKIPLLLGSATPSLESLQQALAGSYRHLRLTQRPSSHPPAKLELVDMRHQRRQGGLLPPVLTAIKNTLAAGKQVLIFINRRGFAPTLACHACGWLAECGQCDARMTLHRQPPLLACHHCDSRRALPDACPQCGSGDLRALGSGTERTEETLQSLFPKTTVQRIDRDSTRRKDSFEKMLKEIQRGEPCLLVGTQMLAKGHHLPHVTLVVVVNADGGLYAADFRALEHSTQLLEQVAGRAGRAAHPGRVLVQTLHPDDPHLGQLAEHGYGALARNLLEERRLAQLPPFCFMALLRVESPKEEAALSLAQQAAQALRQWLGEAGSPVRCLGPVPAPMERRQNRYHLQVMLAADKRSQLHAATSWMVQWLEANREARRVRWSIDIDPQSLS
ncbi:MULTISPECIES: primosomal protein N' [unclassified Halomonas]|uniref:primosomal protein N' n=1 Tax=unclassified Halomonas TaxID=2609666 RepID=UPI0006D95BBF|nr:MULTISPECIES: primosomal protein N' [unclassified Halomonas]KPQ21147.1 MAG: primosomal protein N' (replication factor Y) PriA [Halomonas sp. HL-93]SBR46353.1 replication restart DNA helicase PriA [Halomonas sp. HL-93]SNY98715.1 replication restart DNA helicase PriA [Halomonas sp. hl-4]